LLTIRKMQVPLLPIQPALATISRQEVKIFIKRDINDDIRWNDMTSAIKYTFLGGDDQA
jgi:hypothetical protein